MAKTYTLVVGDTLSKFNTDCTTKLNSGFTCVGGIAKYGENNREYLQAFENAGTNTPRITIANPVLLAFGNVAVGVPSILPLNIIGTYITGNITGVSASPQFVLQDDGTPQLPDVNGNIDVTKNVTFTPASLGDKNGYLTFTTADGQTVHVILTGTGV